MSNEAVMVMCPPLKDYPEAPKDQSHCELVDCTKCKNKMWLSEKKKGVLMLASCIGKEIILACYHCITKMADDNPNLFLDYTRMDL
jgi:hypothetical protein